MTNQNNIYYMKYVKLFEDLRSTLSPEILNIVKSNSFKRWFGDWENEPENSSKVVDSNGYPLVVYHTTSNEKFDEFRPSFDKKIDGKFKQVYKGIDISEDKWSQIDWSELGISPYDEFWFATKPWSSAATTIPCFLNIRNMVIGNEGGQGGQGAYYDYVSTGQDGLMIPNGQGTGSDFYVTITSENIKIADGSNITFNSNSKKIAE